MASAGWTPLPYPSRKRMSTNFRGRVQATPFIIYYCYSYAPTTLFNNITHDATEQRRLKRILTTLLNTYSPIPTVTRWALSSIGAIWI